MVDLAEMAGSLRQLLAEVRSCETCEKHLPLGPRPVVQIAHSAKLVIIGQAPGKKVHESGIPWDDPSGEHLRAWLDVPPDVFYDKKKVALLPMGFCYPGKKGSGDAPPRPECAPLWHEKLLGKVHKDAVQILVGQYAHRYYLGRDRKKSLTETVKAFEQYRPKYFVLPHPSWRSKIWMQKNPWFSSTVLPALRRVVRKLI